MRLVRSAPRPTAAEVFDEDTEDPAASEPANVRSGQLIRSGVGLFIALGIVTAGWVVITGELSPTYIYIMIPTSAIAVICIFGGFISLVRGDIAAQSTINKLVLEEVSGLRGDVRAIAGRQKATDAEVAALIQRVSKLEETLAVFTSPNVVELESMRTLHTIDQRLNGDHPPS